MERPPISTTRHLFVARILSSNTTLLEVIMALISLAWAVYLLLPIDSFGSSAFFHIAGRIAPEERLGVLVLILGSYKLWATYKNYRRCRMIAFFCGFFMWTFVSILFFLGNPASPSATVMYPAMALINGVMFWFAWSDVRKE